MNKRSNLAFLVVVLYFKTTGNLITFSSNLFNDDRMGLSQQKSSILKGLQWGRHSSSWKRSTRKKISSECLIIKVMSWIWKSKCVSSNYISFIWARSGSNVAWDVRCYESGASFLRILLLSCAMRVALLSSGSCCFLWMTASFLWMTGCLLWNFCQKPPLWEPHVQAIPAGATSYFLLHF